MDATLMTLISAKSGAKKTTTEEPKAPIE